MNLLLLAHWLTLPAPIFRQALQVLLDTDIANTDLNVVVDVTYLVEMID